MIGNWQTSRHRSWRLITRWSGRVKDKVSSSVVAVRAAQLNRWATMRRPLGIGLTGFALFGCAAHPLPTSPNPNWTRVSEDPAGCVSFTPRRREAVDINVILVPAFKEKLESQLGAEVPKIPRCWYETPSGGIRLFAGDFCGVGTDVFFERTESTWKLTKTNEIFASCHPTQP